MDETSSTSEAKERLNVRPVTFGALRTDSSGENVVRQFENLARTGTCDVIIAPEYTFYNFGYHRYNFLDDSAIEPVQFQQENGIYLPVGGDTQTIGYLQRLSLLAGETATNICVGTVAERDYIDGVPITHNSSIVIDHNGKIIQVRRKFAGSDSLQFVDGKFYDAKQYLYEGDDILEAMKHPQSSEQEIAAKAMQSALETIKPVTLKTKNGNNVTGLVVVCGERSRPEYLQQAKTRLARPVDAMLVVVDEGDGFYTDQSQHFLNGRLDSATLNQTFDSPEEESSAVESRNRWFDRSIKDNFGDAEDMNNALRAGIVSKRGIWLMSDGRDAGVFPAQERDSVQSTEFTKDYLIAHCQV